MTDRADLTFPGFTDFTARWFAAFALAVVAATLVLLAITVAQTALGLSIEGADAQELIQFSHNWTALFWYGVFLLPLVAGFAAPFALGFSFLPELYGIKVRRWLYMGFGAAAGILLVIFVGEASWRGNPALEFPAAGALGGLVLGILRAVSR